MGVSGEMGSERNVEKGQGRGVELEGKGAF